MSSRSTFQLAQTKNWSHHCCLSCSHTPSAPPICWKSCWLDLHTPPRPTSSHHLHLATATLVQVATNSCLDYRLPGFCLCPPRVFSTQRPKSSFYFLFLIIIVIFLAALCRHAGCGILVPRPGIEPCPLHREHGVLTTGPPGKSLKSSF